MNSYIADRYLTAAPLCPIFSLLRSSSWWECHWSGWTKHEKAVAKLVWTEKLAKDAVNIVVKRITRISIIVNCQTSFPVMYMINANLAHIIPHLYSKSPHCRDSPHAINSEWMTKHPM